MGFKYFFPAARGAYHRNQRGCFCGYGEWALRQKHVLGRNFCFLFKVNRFHHRWALVVFEMIWWWSSFSVYNQTVKNLILANFSHNSNIVKSIIVWPICFPASIVKLILIYDSRDLGGKSLTTETPQCRYAELLRLAGGKILNSPNDISPFIWSMMQQQH